MILGPETTWTAGFHFDSNDGIVNVIIDVSDVDELGGAFSYVPGSHRWERSFTRWIAGKSIPYALGMPADPRTRETFSTLPTMLQGISHFGDDLLDGFPEQDRLWLDRHAVHSDEGDVLVFGPPRRPGDRGRARRHPSRVPSCEVAAAHEARRLTYSLRRIHSRTVASAPRR